MTDKRKNRFQNLNVLALTSALWLKGLKPYSDMLHTHIYVCFLLDTVRLKTVEYSTSLTLGVEFPCSSLFSSIITTLKQSETISYAQAMSHR